MGKSDNLNNIVIAGQTDTGPIRENNEDCIEICKPIDESIRKAKGILIIVADGMGGEKAGEVASYFGVKTVIDYYFSNGKIDNKAALIDAVIKANQVVFEMAQNDYNYEGMGTTLTAAVFGDSYVHFAHVGDSRAYIIRDNYIEQLTRDHTLAVERNLTDEQARRQRISHVLTRVIGTENYVEIDSFTIPFQENECIVLCTDGVTNCVTREEIKENFFRYKTPTLVSQNLINLAKSREGSDNMSIIVALKESQDTTKQFERKKLWRFIRSR